MRRTPGADHQPFRIWSLQVTGKAGYREGMIELFKKGLLAGLGAAVVTKESAEKVLGDLVDRGRITSEEAQQTADRLVEEGRKEFEDARENFGQGYESVVNWAQLVSRAEFEKLQQRVDALEAAAAPAPESSATADAAPTPGV